MQYSQQSFRQSKAPKTIILLIFIYLLSIFIIWLDGMVKVVDKADYAVVLGDQVDESGKPTDSLKARLSEAKQLYKKKQIKKIIVSGDVTKSGKSEAVAMKRYLVKQGVPSRRIIVDSNGRNAHLTAQNSKKWVKPKQSVIVVSQLYRLSRSKMSFHHAGFEKVGSVYPDYFEKWDIFASVREVFLWTFYWITQR